MSSQGIALILTSIPLINLFGADKFYLGLYTQGIIMILLTLSLVGLLISIPWVYLCSVFLIISIFFTGKPLFYPESVQWAPISKMDKIIAGIILFFMLLSIIFSIVYRKPTIENEDEKTKPTPTPTPTK